jgi:hypothetical protein
MGRPKYWYKTKPGYREVGAWAWNDELLWSKIEVSLDTEECWPWLGSMSPSGALLGAFKKDPETGEYRQQMTQARRLLWSSETNEDVGPYQVTMKCANQTCCNPSHFEIKRSNRPEKQQW